MHIFSLVGLRRVESIDQGFHFHLQVEDTTVDRAVIVFDGQRP